MSVCACNVMDRRHTEGASSQHIPVRGHLSVKYQVGQKLKWGLKQHQQRVPELDLTALVWEKQEERVTERPQSSQKRACDRLAADLKSPHEGKQSSYLLNQGCTLTQTPVCWRSRGNCAHNPVWRDLRRARRGTAGPEIGAAASCWSAQGERPAPPASDRPAPPAGPEERCLHRPLLNESKFQEQSHGFHKKVIRYSRRHAANLHKRFSLWILCWPVPSAAVLRMWQVVSKRWTSPRRAAMHSSLSDGWQHRSTSWMQQPNGLANAWSSPTVSVNKGRSVEDKSNLCLGSQQCDL